MGAPELVIEVLSPSNTVHEINDKMAICMANGCRSFWTVDGKRNRVSVTKGDVTRHYGVADSKNNVQTGGRT
jgi:Uma2 family endonuclease